MGGVWERQIQTARRILDTLLREHGSRLNEDSLQTLLCEVEFIINWRQFSIISSDGQDPVSLSTNQILTIKANIVLPTPGNSSAMMFTSADIGVEFSKEYLPTLQKRPNSSRTMKGAAWRSTKLSCWKMKTYLEMFGQWVRSVVHYCGVKKRKKPTSGKNTQNINYTARTSDYLLFQEICLHGSKE